MTKREFQKLRRENVWIRLRYHNWTNLSKVQRSFLGSVSPNWFQSELVAEKLRGCPSEILSPMGVLNPRQWYSHEFLTPPESPLPANRAANLPARLRDCAAK
jgi:hypothetical protein